ncbi:MAG: 5-oxoprolinase subunit B family protein [Arachnia sp.]
MKVLACGQRAVLVEVASLREVMALDHLVRELRTAQVPAWGCVTDQVPAARTLLLRVAGPEDVPVLRRAVAALPRTVTAAAPQQRCITIQVTYDGPDLAEAARLTGLSVEGVVAAHTARLWRAAFGGFAPGFCYLIDGDPRLHLPRRSSPRTVVPAGAVGIAGEFSGVYPRSSPGGWQLIGRTRASLWDEHRDPPALIAPGDLVSFEVAP